MAATQDLKVEHRSEIEAINGRRDAVVPAPDRPRRGAVRWLGENDTSGDAVGEPHPPTAVFDTTGLAISGGGIRSAAFCLGALQALNADRRIDDIDYISTVSGGGFIGAAMVAGMSTAHEFPFAYKDDDQNDLMDNPGVRHVRDHANYLLPRGLTDLFASIAIILRGLVASLAPALAVALLLACATAIRFPTFASLSEAAPAFLGVLGPMPLAVIGLGVLLAHLFLWGLPPANDQCGKIIVDASPTRFARALMFIVAVVFFVELQPLILRAYFNIEFASQQAPSMSFLGRLLSFDHNVTSIIDLFSKALATLGALAALFTRQLQGVIKSTSSDSSWRALGAVLASKGLLLLAALALPLLLWLTYLTLAMWAIAGHSPTGFGHAPGWLVAIAQGTTFGPPAIKYLMGAFGAALGLFTFFTPPNGTTLHALYRERLAAAFLFDLRVALPRRRLARKPSRTWGRVDAKDDRHLPPIGSMKASPRHRLTGANISNGDYIKLSALDENRAPYLLINTTLNIQGSRVVNKRGRNADFFLLSKYWVGSASTGYAPTVDFEQRSPGFDLGTAIAISGAAASSNMGSASIAPLAPTLALLNIRLGYWAHNPLYIWDHSARPPGGFRALVESQYLLCEMFSIIDERSPRVYLTDGGHIENLGVYELLRRRCRFVICVDAEADPDMGFGSLATLQRYARIDLGVRIDNIEWRELRASALTAKTGLDDTAEHRGPHVALADIIYPGGGKGSLLYVKSSLSGDESDIVLDYKRARDAFPHETTGDQFFSEQQFEAYRALGFHAMYGALSGRDAILGLKPDLPPADAREPPTRRTSCASSSAPGRSRPCSGPDRAGRCITNNSSRRNTRVSPTRPSSSSTGA